MPVIRKENLVKNINDLHENPNNAKIHPEQQIKLLAENIRQIGFYDPVIVDESNVILAGHGRVLALDMLGESSVDCVQLWGLSDVEKRAYCIADNRLGELGEWDFERLKSEAIAILQESADYDLSSLGFSESEIESFMRLHEIKNPYENNDENDKESKDKKDNEIDKSKFMTFKNKCPKCGFEYD